MSANLCPYCGTPNTPQARFCKGCGKQLPLQPLPVPGSTLNCPRCNQPLSPGARFCRNCGFDVQQHELSPGTPGSALPPSPQLTPPPPIEQTPPGELEKTLDFKETQQPTYLVVRWMGGKTERYPINKSTILVGRDPGNDVVINHPAVSSHHLSLAATPLGYTVTDLKSTNLTMINGHVIPANNPQPLRQGDVLRIGNLIGNSVSLILQSGAGEAVRALSLGKLDLSNLTSIVIGRDPKSYLPLNHPAVSSRHAMIMKQESGLIIRDLGSTNGTFVNGQRITQAPLKSGDVIQIGPFRLNYDAQSQILAQSMGLGHRIDTIRLGREVAKKKLILDNVSMTVNPGEFIALVGGSGAGKSTLMKAMNGYEPANHGKILLDGEPLYEKLDLYRTTMGYVPQDDIIHRALPVRLALWYAAKLRMPDARSAEIEARIQDALKAVDMVEHANQPVRVLSGGQRKRVSIAVELLARPTLFFLDEPTSGLDPGLEKKMMYDLNRIADEGRTVVLVTHATANIEQCDQVAFMAYGKLAYYGPPDDALKFYDVESFSDIYLKLSQEVDPAKGKPVPPELQSFYKGQGKVTAGVLWADAYRQSPYFQKYVADRQSRLGDDKGAIARAAAPPRRARDSFLRQTIILTRRQFDLIRMDLRTLLILLLMMPLIGLLFGIVSNRKDLVGQYSGDKQAITDQLKKELIAENKKDPKIIDKKYTPQAAAQTLVTMLGLAIIQSGTFVAAYEIVKERAIYQRERAVNLNAVAYVLSKVFVLGVFAIFQVASVIFVLNLKLDMNFPGAVFVDNGVLELFVTFYLGVFASIMFGLFLSAIVPNSDVVLYAILVQLFVQIILGGASFPIKSKLISKTTIAYWTMSAMGSTVDLTSMNEKSQACSVFDNVDQNTGNKFTDVQCSNAKAPFFLDYKHDKPYMVSMWFGLIIHSLFWFILTIIVQVRKKGE